MSTSNMVGKTCLIMRIVQGHNTKLQLLHYTWHSSMARMNVCVHAQASIRAVLCSTLIAVTPLLLHVKLSAKVDLGGPM